MKQKNKYLVAFLLSEALTIFASILSDHHAAWLSAWFVGCVCIWASIKGYVDSRHGDNPSYMIDRYGALHGLRRRFMGMEYDSSYQRRITKQAIFDGRGK